MIKENKFSKYLLYAIGEIVLVVIGILIALQLNTWKDDKQNKKIELDYLNGIVANLERDISELKNLLRRDTITFDAYTNILMPFKDASIKVYTPSFIGKTIARSQFTHQFDGNSIVFEDMKSSGKINYIKSDALRFALLEYYNDSESFADTQKKNNTIINQLKDEAFTDNIDLNSLIEGFIFRGKWSAQLDPLDLSFFLKDKKDPAVKEFANRVSLMKGLLKVNHNGNDYLMERSKRLKVLILDYLKGAQIDFTTELPKGALTAIINGDITTLDKIVTTDINTCFKIEESYPICYTSLSIENNSFASLQYFVEKGANIELACFDKTPLMYAVKYGHLKMVKYLLDNGADINKVSVEGKTALDYALKYKHPEIEAFLRTYKK
ncbi:MAG: ankyrin repeat domain-containing protein [Flavobacteriaceae bacterium]